MALRKKLHLNWEGKDYPLLVTMEVIDRVEDKNGIGKLLAQQSSGDIRFSKVAKFIATVLNEAGANVTQEDVYTGMFADGDASIEEVMTLMGKILGAFFPEPKKKDSATKDKPKKAAA